MNWKIVATLIVGALLVTACGGQPPSPASPATRAGQDEGGTTTTGTDAAKPPPGAQPTPTDARKDVVLHE